MKRKARLVIRELCEERGWNISELSEQASISYPTALALWHQKSVRIDLKVLEAVAEALGVSVRELFAEDGTPHPESVLLDIGMACI